LTYSSIKPTLFLLITFSIDTVQGYLAWWAVRSFILFLDKKWPIENGGVYRIVVQLISTLFIGLLIISALTELVSWIAKGKPAPLDFYLVDLFIIGIWFFVVNGIYIGLHFYNLWKKTEEERKNEMRSFAEGLLVKNGKQEIKLNFDEVAGFSVEGEYVVVSNLSGKKYYLDQSLDKVEKSLPASLFFRLNRQYLLHRQIITGFKREENGKIMVTSSQPESFATKIMVSRTKAPAFKAWFRPEQ
jgi:DNA-binding LytR/AlgR family response regulator